MRSIVVSFFFNKRAADDLEKTRLGFYRSVLHQLLDQCPEALGGLVTSFSRRKDTSGQVGKDWYWQEQNLGTNLAHAICSILDSHALWLFVDALDESNEGTADTMVREFKLLLKINPSSDTNFHICFTARHFPVIATDCDFELQVDQKNVDDIKKYVLEEFSNRCQQLSNSEIPKTVITGAHGIFLWARVALEEAIRLHHSGRGLPFIVQALKRLPPELQDLFRSIIISGAEEVSSLQVMQWICFAARALSLDELRWAMIVDDDNSKQSVEDCRNDPSFITDDDGMTRRLRALSCGLAEVVDTKTSEGTTKRVQFIHETVKEFFFNHGLRLLRGADVISNSDPTATTTREQRLGHYRLAKTCIRYLSIVDLSSYTAKALSKTEMTDLKIYERKYLLQISEESKRRWSEEEEQEQEQKRKVVKALLKTGKVDVNFKNIAHESALLLASEGGHIEIVKILLSCDGVDVKECDGDSAIMLAAKNGHLRVVEALLDTGKVDVSSRSLRFKAALLLASERRHLDVVKILVDRGRADVNLRYTSPLGMPALLYAIEEGHLELVQVLVGIAR
ncbi:hypothetical protein MY5147_006263 [Beauveria neobassiana]